MTSPKEHFEQTRDLIKAISKDDIANWLLNEGYFPEQYVLPPSFAVSGFTLNKEPFNKNLSDLCRRNLINISFPKSTYTSRMFGIMHPWNYHDIVFWIMTEWEVILNHIFSEEQRIFSYSFPIPVSNRNKGGLSPLRSGRMIYEWIAMAEGDLVVEANKFQLLARTDITNCYNSIYTHSIAWALEGREEAFADKDYALPGNRIDRLVQYSNDGRTNGISIGPALSDLISEIVLARIDRNVSGRLTEIEFLGTRFKDDYRFLCNTDEDAKTILRVLSEELIKFNLSINENKTKIVKLPTGLYREHDREYFQYSLKKAKEMDFKTFEHTLIKTLDIHQRFPGTSILEKFFGELFNDDYQLKVKFSPKAKVREKQILKMFSLLLLVTRESEKVLCHVLSVIEVVYKKYRKTFDLKVRIKEIVEHEIETASSRKSAFSIVWYVFFARYMSLGITNFKTLVSDDNRKNPFVKSIINSSQAIFKETQIVLFRKPKDCKGSSLAKQCAVFNRDKDEITELDDQMDVWADIFEAVSPPLLVQAIE